MIVVEEVLKVSVQTALVEYDHVIQALAAEGADHPFDISPGLGVQLHLMGSLRIEASG